MTRFAAASAAFLLVALATQALTGEARAQNGVDGMRLLGRNNEEFAHMMDFHVVGDYAYASNGLGAGFQTYDISNPAIPIRVNAKGLSAWRVVVAGDTAFSFTHSRGVEVYDVSSVPPILLDAFDPADASISYEGGARLGDRLYAAAHQIGIEVLDLGTPGDLHPISRITLADNACWNAVESGGYLYVANGRFGLSVVNLAGTPTEIATLALPGLANDIEIAGATLFMGLEGDILAVGSYPYAERFDVSDPAAIERSGWDATLVYAMGADVGVLSNGDTVVVVADWRGMAVYAPADDPVGDIDVYPHHIDFGRVDAAPRDTTVVVRNNGSAVLNVSLILPPSDTSVSSSSLVLGPGESEEITVTVAGTNGVRAPIHYFSDDPEEGDVLQMIYKNNAATFPQVGSEAPDFTLLGTDGQPHTLSDYRGRVIYLEFGAAW